MCNIEIDMGIFFGCDKNGIIMTCVQKFASGGRWLQCIGRREIDHLATKFELGFADRHKTHCQFWTSLFPFLWIDSQSLGAHACKMRSICLCFVLVSWEEFSCISQGVWFSLNSLRYSRLQTTHCPTHLYSLVLLYLTHLLRTLKCFTHTWLKAVSAIYSFGSSVDGISNWVRIFL